MKILIRNLNRETVESELSSLFEEIGRVQYCNIVMDKESGKSKGFAFVEMPVPGEAKAAIKTLNNKFLNGAKLRVKKAPSKEAGK